MTVVISEECQKEKWIQQNIFKKAVRDWEKSFMYDKIFYVWTYKILRMWSNWNPIYCWLGGFKVLKSFWRIVWPLLIKLKKYPHNNQVILFLEKWKYMPQNDLYKIVDSGLIHSKYPNCLLEENGYTEHGIFLTEILLSN